ncbi:TPA: ATP-binding protein [Burkholderia cenocepacia]|nr:ATP-binding protein [Burkholderia cenocepacia]
MDVRLSNLSEVTALVGRNGAGKTNIMQAIDWVGAVVVGVAETTENGKISVEFSTRRNRYTYNVNRVSTYSVVDGKYTEHITFEESLSLGGSLGDEVLLLERNGERVYLSGNEEPLSISNSISSLRWLISFLPKTDDRRKSIIEVWHYFTKVTYYPLSDVGSSEEVTFVRSDELRKWSDGVDGWKCVSASDTIRQIIKMHLEGESGKFDELQTLLGPEHLDVISEITVDEVPLRSSAREGNQGENVAYVVSFKPAGHTGAFPFDRLSFGTKRVIQMIVSMLGDEPNVSLIEQPEDGIHPALLYKIVPIVRSYMTGRQFIFASHSPAVLNAVAPEEVRLVEMANGRTYARSLSDVEIGAAHNYLAREGPLADFINSL